MEYNSVLLTNDDGYLSPGINILKKYFRESGVRTIVVAPDKQHSGASGSITIAGNLYVSNYEADSYNTTGTPVDCVKFALKNIFDKYPDLVVSGVNKGDNSGHSVFYSGTVGGAGEGALQGINAVAISMYTAIDDMAEFDEDAIYAMVQDFFENDYQGGHVSVNLPLCSYEDFNGFKDVAVSTSTFVEKYTEIEPGVYEIGLDYYREDKNGEIHFLRNNYATVSPIVTDWTDYSRLK